MRFFKKKSQNQGLLVLAFTGEGLVAASVRTAGEGKPTVALVVFYPGADVAQADLLESLTKELRTNGFRCATLLNGHEYQMLAVDSPNVPPDELKKAVSWRLKDLIDFPVDDATVDLLEIPVEEGGRANHVFAVAARNSIIEQRMTMFADAHVGLSVIDIPEMAQRNISSLLAAEGRGLAMLSFSADGGLLTVTFKGELYLSRRIDVPLAQLFEADADRKHASFDKITLELQRSLDHFDRQFHFINVAKLVLAPTGASGLDEYLSSNLYMPVETLDLGSVFDLGGNDEMQDPAKQQRFFFVLGAALRTEQAVA
jgi:MSHA biogenesis protein MshI